MKLRLTRRKKLLSARRSLPGVQPPPLRPSRLPMEERRENLYRAIERTQAFLHRNGEDDGVMAAIRRYYPAPLFFVEANRRALGRVGLSRLDAFYYAMIPALTRTALSQQWGEKPTLSTLSRMGDYLKTLYIGVHVECFYLVMLNRRGALIRAALLQRGAVDEAPFYLGQVLDVALAEGAKYLVLAHNHPGGTRNPSREDLRCTLRAINAFASLGIPLLDHVIVAGDAVVSIRQSGLLPELLWTSACPGSRVVRDWLDADLLSGLE